MCVTCIKLSIQCPLSPCEFRRGDHSAQGQAGKVMLPVDFHQHWGKNRDQPAVSTRKGGTTWKKGRLTRKNMEKWRKHVDSLGKTEINQLISAISQKHFDFAMKKEWLTSALCIYVY